MIIVSLHLCKCPTTMKSVYAFTFVLLLQSSLSAKLPASFKRCDKNKPDFNKCLRDAVSGAVKQLTKPFREVGLPSLEPLEVPSLTIAAGTSAVGLEQKFKNVQMYGFTKIECKEVNIDFDKKTLYADCSYPSVKLEADYDLKGKILLLDVYGSGKAKITLDKLRAPATYKFKEYEKNGQTHLQILEVDLTTEPEHVTFQFDNLFNGDKTLGENINKVMNDNWKDIYDEIKPNYSEAFSKITKSIFNSLLDRVPLSELF